LYVGHTNNFVQRKHAHKQSCINPKSNNHKCKLYSIIRENGGWKNWIMDIVHFFKCNNQCEARTKEQEYFILLNATLNSVEPMPAPKPKTPVKIVPSVIEPPENANKFKHGGDTSKTIIIKTHHCEACNFISSNRKDYNRHLTTNKHIKRSSANLNSFTTKNSTQFICNNCNKHYKERTGLWRHTQTCKPIITHADESDNFIIDKEFVMSILKQNADIIKENSELTNLMMESHKSAHQMIMNTQNQLMEVIKTQNLSATSK
jgi:hypothetical protein